MSAAPRSKSPFTLVLGAVLALLALFFASPAKAQSEARFVPPPLVGHVVDTAGKLTPEETARLDRKLDALRRGTGFEVVVLVPASLAGETIEDVAYRTFNTWKLGQAGADNGVLLVLAPAERRVRIVTGRGVGGALTDLQSNDILRNVITPLMQQDRVAEAADQGTTAIARALTEGTLPAERAPPQAQPLSPWRLALYIGGGILVLILAIVSPTFRSMLFFFLLFGRGGRGGGGGGFRGGGGSSGGGGTSDSY